VENVSIQVLVAGLPRLLSEVLCAGVVKAPDLALAGVSGSRARPGSSELDQAICDAKPDAAIIGMNTGETEALEHLQLRHSRVAIVAMSPDGAHAWQLELCAELRLVDSPSPSILRTAIYDAVAASQRFQQTNGPCRINQ